LLQNSGVTRRAQRKHVHVAFVRKRRTLLRRDRLKRATKHNARERGKTSREHNAYS
jgi:hypothetical protein